MAPPCKRKQKHSSADHRLISSSAAAAIGGKQQQQTLGSAMTSSGKRQSLRVAKNCQTLRKIWVCNDVLMDVLPLFDRPQLGLKLALLSPRFNALVDKHFDGKHELTLWRQIRIRKGDGPEAKLFVRIDGKFVGFPLPDRPMPDKIRFDYLSIEYIDHSVIKFLRANHQIFDKGTKLDLSLPSGQKAIVKPIWKVFAHEIWPIFAPNIRDLNFSNGLDLDNLRRHTSPTILTDLNHLNSIDSDDWLPDVIADDGPKATGGQALSKWLNTPRKDGKPKQLSCGDSSEPPHTEWINEFKEAFLHATTTSSSASYIIRLQDFEPAGNAPFELINERTNEKLTLEKEENDDEENEDDDDDYDCDDWLLKRCQIGKTIQWENEHWNNLNNVKFTFYSAMKTNWIGQLSSPKAGQKNAKNCVEMKAGPSGQRKKK